MQSSGEERGDIRRPSEINNKRKRGNNRMGKIRDLFKKIKDTKGTFPERMGMIKDRTGKDLTEAEEIKKWQESIEDYTKKVLMTWMNTIVWSLT